MAKKRKHHEQRDVHIPVASKAAVPVYLPSLPKSSLSDLRFYQPQKPKVSFDDLGRRSVIRQSPVNTNLLRSRSPKGVKSAKRLDKLLRAFRERLSFQQPRGVLVCVRRKARREVLFAKRNTGRGSKSRVRRRNSFSHVRC